MKPYRESEVTDMPPPLNPGGALEEKRGVVCLRRADALELMADGRMRVTREWLPPGASPWSADFYRTE